MTGVLKSMESQRAGRDSTTEQTNKKNPHGYLWIFVLKWRRQWHPTPELLPGKSHGQRSLVGCSP